MAVQRVFQLKLLLQEVKKMEKCNCWDFKKCEKTAWEDCSVTREERFDGFNGGKNGGRLCWFTKELTNGTKAKGQQAQKCAECGFFTLVSKEEGPRMIIFM